MQTTQSIERVNKTEDYPRVEEVQKILSIK